MVLAITIPPAVLGGEAAPAVTVKPYPYRKETVAYSSRR
jgi:hypothetical protein